MIIITIGILILLAYIMDFLYQRWKKNIKEIRKLYKELKEMREDLERSCYGETKGK
jgi:hypothetical protein